MGIYDDDEREPVKTDIMSAPRSILPWIAMLVLGLIVKLLANSTSTAYLSAPIFDQIANFVLFMPGAIIFPLFFGALIGLGIGEDAKNVQRAIKSSFVNAVYACVQYLVSIVIIYEVIYYVEPTVAPTSAFLVYNWIAIPSVLLVCIAMLFSVISYTRKNTQA